MRTNNKGFTFIEICVVAVIASAVAGISIVTYNGAMEKSYARNAIMGLRTIQSAQKAFFAKNGEYWPMQGANPTVYVDSINFGLGINLKEDHIQYLCTNNGGISTYNCYAAYPQMSGYQWKYRLRQDYVAPQCACSAPCPM